MEKENESCSSSSYSPTQFWNWHHNPINKDDTEWIMDCIGNRYYIYKRVYIAPYISRTEYLHKDESIETYCGTANFFDSYDEAVAFLKNYLEKFEFLNKKEFEL